MALVRGADRSRSDRATTTVEYALVLAGVVALVGLAFLAAPDAVSRLYGQVACRLMGSCPETAGPGGPIDPWDDPDPVVRATWGEMVVLGDSYSSGEGGEQYGITGSTPSCHASATAYGPAVAKSLDMTDRLDVAACTGATLANLTGNYPDHHQLPQIRAVDGQTSLITMTLGGNDLDWSGLLASCITQRGAVDVVGGLIRQNLDVPCQVSQDATVTRRIATLEPRLEQAYAALRRRAPHARIVVLGYPHLFPDRPTQDLTKATVTMVSTSEERWINTKTDQLNRVIAEAAHRQGVEFVNATGALRGHELTTDDPWIWGLDLRAVRSEQPVKASSHDLHPKPAGQAAMARLAERQIEHPAP